MTYIVCWVVGAAWRDRHCQGASARGAVELGEGRHVLGWPLRRSLGGLAGMLGGLPAASPRTLTHPADIEASVVI